MPKATLEDLARRLRSAYETGPVAPLRDGLPPTDAASAYTVQHINTQFWEGQGRKIVGRKAGLTSKAVQAQLGVDQPDYGVLFADMRVEDGGVLAARSCFQPKVEAEIALVLHSDLGVGEITPQSVAAAIGSVHAAIEIVDSRIADWKITFADTVADNGSSAFFVLASDNQSFVDQDLWSAGMVMRVNGDVVSTGAGAAALGHPLNAAAWLARNLAEQGDPLKAGDVLLTGALGPMVALTPGDRVEAFVGGVGSCSCASARA